MEITFKSSLCLLVLIRHCHQQQRKKIFLTLTTGKNDSALHKALVQASKGNYRAAQAIWADNHERTNLWGSTDEV
jgi:hypothetical protein